MRKTNVIPGAVGLCAGRHEMPVSEYIFDQVSDVFAFEKMRTVALDFVRSHCDVREIGGDDGVYHSVGFKPLNVIVTGLSSLTAEVVGACAELRTDLVLWHFDRESGEYVGQQFSFSRLLW